MIEMTNGEVIQAAQALEELGRERLPVPGALRVRKVTRAVQAHLQDVEAVRMDLLKRHARTDEAGELVPGEGGIATFEDGARERFIADWEALLAERVEFEYGVRVSDLGNIEVRPSVLVELGALLEEEG